MVFNNFMSWLLKLKMGCQFKYVWGSVIVVNGFIVLEFLFQCFDIVLVNVFCQFRLYSEFLGLKVYFVIGGILNYFFGGKIQWLYFINLVYRNIMVLKLI